jgi:hypothetical protein
MAETTDRTAGGNLRSPSKQLVIEWVKLAWTKLSPDLIMTSHKCCGFSISDADDVENFTCLKNQPEAIGVCKQALLTRKDATATCDPFTTTEVADDGPESDSDIVVV